MKVLDIETAKVAAKFVRPKVSAAATVPAVVSAAATVFSDANADAAARKQLENEVEYLVTAGMLHADIISKIL